MYVVIAHTELHDTLCPDRTVHLPLATSLVVTWLHSEILIVHKSDFMRLLPVGMSKLYVCTEFMKIIIIMYIEM